ncbi:MAG: hypothetical protein COA75_14875 [Cellvibrionales bacterium]|nr:MAG: hypothetical protein COA75_14875 [Cellvibrionales bacterium]
MKATFFTILLLFMSLTVHATSSVVGTIEEYGIYKSVGALDTFASSGTAAKHSTFGSYAFVKKTNKVQIAKGVSFGFVWSASGFPDIDAISITHILEHPPIITPNGETVRVSKETYYYKPVNGKITHTEGYSFFDDFELVEGQYKFTVLYKGNTIVTKTFIATRK